jgi:hypothetical protein
MGVIKHSGEVIHSKSILFNTNRFHPVIEFNVNATNIIAHNLKVSIVEIYNFKLELVHSIKLEKKFYGDFELNNYEIVFDNNDEGFSDSGKQMIECYNYQTVNLKKNKLEICMDKNGFEAVEEKFFKFVGVNDRFFFIGGKCEKDSDHSTIICLLNREDENKIYKSFKCTTDDLFFYNAEFCARFYYFDDEDKFRTSINVYDKDNNDSGEPSAIVKGVEYENEILFVGESRNEKRNYSYYKYIYSRHIFASSYKQY